MNPRPPTSAGDATVAGRAPRRPVRFPAARAQKSPAPSAEHGGTLIATPFGPYRPPALAAIDGLAPLRRVAPVAPSIGRRVLIVDEDPLSCVRTAAILRDQGLIVNAADSAAAADRMRARTACDLIIASLRLPPTPLLGWLAELTRTEGAPVVTIAENLAADHLVATTLPSVAARLIGPVDSHAIRTVVAQLLPF